MFDGYDEDIRLIHIRKEGAVIYFVENLDADDEQGLIFINDESNNILDGIKSIKRIGGNSYEYRTNE